ncbi:kinase-like domain-containing protein [Neohortaea acidophila]|uniref:1-phosphatidylinositol 4-kinase n=1 Tax=Neohortaea acidophila TaxID=245834 RepID=A0A6A6PNT8_9PEZI|nr:kinase-like domain-containing protein [Neohortaea acidophila]KAF2481739.1 kinase-like domain-containing protein [Neohortaea acidophila]
MSWNLLERFIESEHFNRDPSLTVAYLARYAEHVGIHYVLSSKLRQFSYEEIEFFLPQLCHLLISIDNESMALEEFIVDLCEESVNGALLTFWLLQTYLHDLSAQPASDAFRTCRRLYNKVQHIVFGGTESVRRERIQDNTLPVTVLSSLVLASVGVPLIAQHVAPLAVAQARKVRPVEDGMADLLPQTPTLARSNTVGARPSAPRPRRQVGAGSSGDGATRRSRRPTPINVNGTDGNGSQPSTPKGNPRSDGAHRPDHRRSLALAHNNSGTSLTICLPSPRLSRLSTSTPSSPGVPRRTSEMWQRQAQGPRQGPAAMSTGQKTRLLRQNYFRSEMQFLTALEGISSRLVVVPKPARLSALRAELALVSQDLPAEVDIPVICPPDLLDGFASRSRHHRIVRLNPAEATSLNSAEKVPYLLMLEVLKEDFDFDPESESNNQLLANLVSETSRQKRRLFDTSNATREAILQSPEDVQAGDSVFEPANGDLSSADLLQTLEGYSGGSTPGDSAMRSHLSTWKESPRMSAMSSAFLAFPNQIDPITGRSSSPGPRPSPQNRPQNLNQAEVSALADHMRTASQMLAQLELSAAKRPKTEVAAIKAKIIASMQSLEEQSFLVDDTVQSTNFDAMVAKASEEAAHTDPSQFPDEALGPTADPKLNTRRGADRMENDAKTGGIQRKGDRDDPSAAMFGEAWEDKKERIRRSSPYGWAKNWDLVSVIVKTGADLRQEAFACQLIAVCSKIWTEHKVPVWVKNMRILVTGESSGLIETITNAVSLHSIKRSLTIASMTTSTNAKKRFATLADHFSKTFGAPDSPPHQKAMDCFVRSLAAYSIVSYVLQLKDRHNGNILIDSDGHMIHIDFGFMLSNSPGNMGFEAAPFKLTFEYIELLGGLESEAFAQYKELMKDAFQALRREAERIVTLVELMGRESKMACYGGGLPSVVSALRSRFVLEKSKEEAREWVEDLVAKSAYSYYTRLYDTFQYRTQGIY